MQVPLVLTVIGRDRPGLVESIAALVARRGGNWLESRMCRLGGEFAGILRIHIEASEKTALEEDLRGLQGQGLSIVCTPGTGAANATGTAASIELVGQDRPGIVHEISHLLAKHSVNVEELTTECSSAPMTGETLFKARARVTVPESCPLPQLRAELERIAGNLMVELKLEEL